MRQREIDHDLDRAQALADEEGWVGEAAREILEMVDMLGLLRQEDRERIAKRAAPPSFRVL